MLFSWNRYLGLEIRATGFCAVELERRPNGRVRLEQLVAHAWQPGEVVADDGRLANPEALETRLRAALKEAGVKARRVHLALPSHGIVLRTLHLPPLPRKALRDVVRVELATSLQLPFDDPVFDVVPWPGVSPDENGGVPVQLVAAPRALVQPYVDALRACRLQPLSVDVGALSHLRAVRHFRPQERPGAVLLVNLSPTGADVSIYSEGMLRVTRHIVLAPDAEEAVPVGGEVLPAVPEAAAAAEKPAGEAKRSRLSPLFLNDLVSELERMFSFFRYTLNQREQPLAEILLCGEWEELPQVALDLSERLGAPVVWDVGGDLRGRRRALNAWRARPYYWLTAFGAALKPR